jgi:hypothetical protein
MRTRLLIPAALVASAAVLPAQDRWRPEAVEVRPFAGVFVPVGAQRADFKSATMMGAQAAMEFNRHFHALGSVGWTHGHNKMFAKDLTHIWQYDLGVELNLVRDVGYGWLFRPFLGTGAGGRTYDYRALTAGTRTCLAGYGTAGAEMQRGTVAFRVEAREYLSCFESPVTNTKNTRNDVGLSFGLAYHLR